MNKERELLKRCDAFLDCNGYYNELKADIVSCLSEPEWKPIDTAPKDGKTVRGGNYGKSGKWSEYDCYFVCNAGYRNWYNFNKCIVYPQYWIEKHIYPEPPKVNHDNTAV